MRNPLHFSSALLVKRAGTQPPIINIPAFTPANAEPVMSDDQISSLLQNIQTYPEDQQQKILNSINKDYDNSSYRGGFFGNIGGNIGNYVSSKWNALQGGLNWASNGLFGAKPFDAQDSDRYRAETVLRTAAKNPDMYKRVTERLNTATAPAATTAPAQTNAPTPAAPAPVPVAPATNNAQAVANKVLTGGYIQQQPVPAAKVPLLSAPKPTPTPAAPQPATPVPPAPKPIAQANPAPSSVAPAAAPRKEGLIEGKPAGQWIAENKARQAQEATAYNNNKIQAMNPTMAAAAGQVYNPTAGRMVPPGFNPYK